MQEGPVENSNDAIAVLGMAFRFPGDLGSEMELWKALSEGKDMVTQISRERWDTERLQHPKRSEPGRANTFAAGVLSRVDEFDAAFFGISPREAAWMDPQQRLLLELSWEALENSAIKPSHIAGSNGAVFIGISSTDYGMHAIDDIASVTSHTMTGNTLSIAANRISYIYDLHGPSMAIDTACSSSLVAFHSACCALRNGETSLAMVGGVSLLLHPFGFVGFTKASMLSADGQCRAFDASGAGYVRGEGGAVFVLKLLKQALADGDPIQAVILGTGANSDGGRKTGMTIPSVDGQVELMRSVLRRTGLHPNDIDYIEAHGTGTVVGDPIETAAIGKVYGSTRSDGFRLPIGSIKTNLGHLEPASGMAGLAKAILILKHRVVPPSLRMATPNPHIKFAEWNLQVVTKLLPLRAEKDAGGLVVGVNSFGFGGSNAHVLVQEFKPSLAGKGEPPVNLPPLFLSARTGKALIELSGRYAELIRRQPHSYYDIAYGAAYRRDRLDHRLAIRANTTEEVVQMLEQVAQGERPEGVVFEDGDTQAGKVAFVYAGNGAQWLGMGRRLLLESPRFLEVMTHLDGLISRRAGFSILIELQATPEASRLQDTAVAQPLLFAMQVALTTILREDGVNPVAVAGHSVGEVAAAWAVDALSLEQAVEVICARSAAQARTAGEGRMAAVGLSEAAMRSVLTGDFVDIEVAGINSPLNVTVSGPLELLEKLGVILRQSKVVFRMLDLDYAFHSCAMDPIRPLLLKELDALTPRSHGPKQFVSTVTGEIADGAMLKAQYWWDNVRKPVQFDKAISTMAKLGCRIFIEISPHAILQRYVSETLRIAEIKGSVLPTLRKGDDGENRLKDAALRVHLLSEQPALESVFPVRGAPVLLPTYPWQRERHWHPQTAEANSFFSKRCVHPLLGWRVKDADGVWENVLDPQSCTWLADHKVGSAMVFPGTGYVEMALAAAREHFGGSAQEIEELDILSPIIFDGEHARSIRFDLNLRDGGFQILSRQRLENGEWTLNAVGRLPGTPTAVKPSDVHDQVTHHDGPHVTINRERHHQLMRTIGLEYGPCFQGFAKSSVYHQRLEGELAMPAALCNGLADYLLHPALLDACWQSLAGFFHASIEAGQGVPFLPIKVGRLRLLSSALPSRFTAVLRRQGLRSILVDFELQDAHGIQVATVDACRFRAAPTQRRTQAEPACWVNLPYLRPLDVEQTVTTLPTTRSLIKALRLWFADQDTKLNRTQYIQGASPLFEAMAIAFIRDAFESALRFAPDRLQKVLGGACAPNRHDAYIQWMLAVLRQEGLLSVHGDGSFFVVESDLPTAQTIWRTLLRDYPSNVAELVLAARIGRALPALLAEDTVVTPDFEAQLLRSRHFEAFFDDSPGCHATTLAAQKLLEAVVADWPPSRRLRVLEILVGANACAQSLIERANGVSIDYVIAHADVGCRDRLIAQHAELANVVVAAVEGDCLELHAERASLPEHFDVVLVRHALHACENPVGAVAYLRRKLVRGGLLVIAERHPDVFADFLWGLSPSWWKTDGGGQTVSRLHSHGAWQDVLVQQEFVEVQSFQESASEALAVGAYLVVGKRPRHEVVSATTDVPSANWVILCDADGTSQHLSDGLCSRLQSQGQRAKVFALAQVGVKPLDALLVQAQDCLGSINHIVCLHCGYDDALSPSAASSVVVDAGQASSSMAMRLVELVQAIGRSAQQPQLWVVTAGGALVEGLQRERSPHPEQAALWGAARVLMNEHPGLNTTLVDLDIAPQDHATAERLQYELLQPDGETEVVLTAHGRFVPRMERLQPAARDATQPNDARYRLDFVVPGQLRNLAWFPQPQPTLVSDEVEVRVVAAGLNFRDVMYVMGLLPDEAVENGYAGASLGLEFSGVVSRVAKEGGEYVVGDPVIGFGSSCFSSHVVTRSIAIAHKPSEWSFEAAATVPTVFFTVYYALKHLANVQRGERVLIHGAAGGVGIAAVQLAVHLGAEIYATVGSPEKRDFVTLLGADRVFDSRSLDFADDILSATGGEGVDVVLNSLAGEAIRRNLRVLRPFGRFLELGKRDFFENTPIGLRPFKDNICYFGIDADQLQLARPALAGKLFREVMALFREGVLFPLPYRVYPANHVVDAFRSMQQSRHIGKVVVAMNSAPITTMPSQLTKPEIGFERDTTWLISGGTAGFGLESARWLASRGVGRLVLLGRRGLETPGVAETSELLKRQGTHVDVWACDVADGEALQAVLQSIKRSGPPLVGVLHAAAVFDDGLITNLDATRMESVLNPKVQGAWNLHRLTIDFDLKYFVLYSSVSTTIGNAGQANYVAANAALEGLAISRRAMGLAATCIGWGPIDDSGYLARNQAVKESLSTRLGASPLSSRQALDMLDYFLEPDAPAVITVADFDWATLSRILPSAKAHRFDGLRKLTGEGFTSGTDAPTEDIQALIHGKSIDEARSIVSALVTREVALVLCINPERIGATQSLFDIGMDSLMGVELALGLEKRFNVQLPAMALSETPTVERVSARIIDRILCSGHDHDLQANADTAVAHAVSLAAQHGAELSEEEVKQLVEATQTQPQWRTGR